MQKAHQRFARGYRAKVGVQSVYFCFSLCLALRFYKSFFDF